MKYAVIIERADTGFGAYVPDLPGCVALGQTPQPKLSGLHRITEARRAIMISDIFAKQPASPRVIPDRPQRLRIHQKSMP